VLRDELDPGRTVVRTARGLKASLQALIERGGDGASGLRDLAGLLRYAERVETRSEQLVERADSLVGLLRGDTAELGLITRTLGDHVMGVRLVASGTVFRPLERMVRDLAHAEAKEVRLVIEGAETEIDRMLLEQLRDPMMHMLRNAVDHGIEPPDARAALGKPRLGAINLTVTQHGGSVQVTLADDGRGLDPARLRASAVEKHLLTPERAASLGDAEARELIFQPGFSTASVVTDTSGRGVGMDVVREHVERLRGHVEVASTPGQGTRFMLTVPLTLATERAILVRQGQQVFAMPSLAIERTGRLQAVQVVPLEGRPSITVEGHPLPLLPLADLLEGIASAPAEAAADGWLPFLVLRQGERRVALHATALVGEQEIVVKPLGWPLRRVRGVSGAAVLSSGQTVIILNPTDLLRSAWSIVTRGGTVGGARPTEAAAEHRVPRLLVVDDSLTTRTLERSILEAAGYDVLVAGNGAEALRVLQDEAVDLLVTDVEMPVMDGFTLTAEVRRDERMRHLPVVLVTSLGDREHRERGAAVGADAYVVKSSFDQGELLTTIGRLL
jgi:two-component system chemotaxis sensor kinase CheA